MLTLSGAYNKSLQEEATLTAEQLKTRHVGKQDPKRHLEEAVEKAVGDQVVQNLGTMLLSELWTCIVPSRRDELESWNLPLVALGLLLSWD